MTRFTFPRMIVHRIFLPRWASWTAAVLALFMVLDLAIFFLMPVKLLYFSQPAPVHFPVDVAAILFHDFNGNRTGISTETKRRLHSGIKLLQSGKAGSLMVVGGSRSDPGSNGAVLMADYLRSIGIPDKVVIVEDSSLDSRSNLEQIQALMQQGDLQSAGLVSSPYHLLRMKMLKMGAHTMQYIPYDITNCLPPLTRKEIWLSAHYNLAAYLAAILLPSNSYRWIVAWIRENTEF